MAKPHKKASEETFGQIAVLKKYLRSTHVPEAVLEELDTLCHDNQQR
jgi:hypothetical protein